MTGSRLRRRRTLRAGGHGYGGMFSLSLFDKHWKPKMSRAEAADLVDKCIAEVRERLVTAPAKYHVKIVDKAGRRDFNPVYPQLEGAWSQPLIAYEMKNWFQKLNADYP